MNKQQKDYAIGRINSITAEKIAAIKAKYTKPGIKLSPEERLVALKQGKFKVRTSVSAIYSSTDVEDAVLFTGERETQRDDVKIDAESAKVHAEATRIKDQLMLGDSEQALAMIEKFSK